MSLGQLINFTCSTNVIILIQLNVYIAALFDANIGYELDYGKLAILPLRRSAMTW